MVVEEKMTRKGPWTEEEDVQLALYVNMLDDRRWDFLAKVSGLKRSGKSCRLRWVNYLQPGLKHDKITPQEELLILQLHSKWGNRWSKIARKLPGRTDNEIKNYWRTHMRKKALEDRKINKYTNSSSSSSSLSNSSSSSSIISGSPAIESRPIPETDRNLYDDDTGSSMDDIWKDMELWAGDDIETKTKKNYYCGKQQEVESIMTWNYYWSDLEWMNMNYCNQGQSSFDDH